MSIQGGQYLDQAGNRVRRWMWPDLSRGPYAPLSPIFISLNRHVGVRILAQDKIFVSFLAKGRQAKFNMGTKVQVLFLCRAIPHSGSRASRKLPSAFILWWVLPVLSHAPFPKSKLWLYVYSCHSYGDGHLASPSSLQGATLWDSTHRQVPGYSPKGHPGYDPRGQGAGQLLSSAGSWHRGRFVCWRWKLCPQLGWLCPHVASVAQVSAGSQLPPPARLGEDELLLLAFRVRILQLFDRMRGCLNFPSSEQWNKMQPPMYLMTQAVKILELCMAADISDELRSSIQAIVNAQ